jgi:hypothetical protein
MTTLAIITFGVIILLMLFYLIFYVIYPVTSTNDVIPKMLSLGTKTDVAAADVVGKTLLTTGSSTVMGFFKLNNGDRTTKYSEKFIPLIQVASNWYLEMSPSGNGDSSTRMRVQTNRAGTVVTETIELPPIPKQKWVCIAILREGRRFDILYDNKIVTSHRLENYPVIITNPLSVGSTGLDGSVIHVLINSTRLSPTEVERERVKYVDTNNMILEANVIDMSLPGMKYLAQCPPGLPCNSVTQPPSNNLVQWSTPYA